MPSFVVVNLFQVQMCVASS